MAGGVRRHAGVRPTDAAPRGRPRAGLRRCHQPDRQPGRQAVAAARPPEPARVPAAPHRPPGADLQLVPVRALRVRGRLRGRGGRRAAMAGAAGGRRRGRRGLLADLHRRPLPERRPGRGRIGRTIAAVGAVAVPAHAPDPPSGPRTGGAAAAPADRGRRRGRRQPALRPRPVDRPRRRDPHPAAGRRGGRARRGCRHRGHHRSCCRAGRGAGGGRRRRHGQLRCALGHGARGAAARAAGRHVQPLRQGPPTSPTWTPPSRRWRWGAVTVDVGEADGRPFLNTASLGHYAEFVAWPASTGNVGWASRSRRSSR